MEIYLHSVKISRRQHFNLHAYHVKIYLHSVKSQYIFSNSISPLISRQVPLSVDVRFLTMVYESVSVQDDLIAIEFYLFNAAGWLMS